MRRCRWSVGIVGALVLVPLLTSTTLTIRPGTTVKSLRGQRQAAPEGSQFVQVREHEIFGIRLTEVVLGPAAIDDELPMLVHFHGRGDKPHLPTGDHGGTPATRLIFPWAPQPLGEGFTWFPLSVTERHKPEKVLGHYIRERADEMAKVLDELMARRPTEGRAFVTGFSQGGMMSFALAMRHPSLVSGAVPVAGWLPQFLVKNAHDPSLTYPPIRAMHGRGDSIVPLLPTAELCADLRSRGLDISLEVFDWGDHSMNDAMHARHRELILALIERMRRQRVGLG